MSDARAKTRPPGDPTHGDTPAGPGTGADPVTDPGVGAPSARALRRVIVERQRRQRIPGVCGGVARAGRLVWSDGVGSADLERPGVPPDEDTQFLIASISKTFTAVVVMALRDEGRVSLDDTVEQHVPESRHAGVTVRQLLSHVSGMQREPVGDVWASLRNPDRAGMVASWNEAERVLRPHHRWHYSNLCYALLGEIVARLEGREWIDSVRARILEPLGMRRTGLGLTPPHARGYYVPPFSDVPVAEPVLDLQAMAPAGGLASTPRDLATWASFLAAPSDEVLAADSLEEMRQPQIMADLERWQLAFGLGLMLVRAGERIFVGHTGGMPGHVTGLFVHRESGTAGMALMNSTAAGDPAELAVALAAHVIEDEPAPLEPWRPGVDVPTELRDVIGRWYSEGAAIDFSVRTGRLEARHAALPEHKPSSVFVRVGADLYRTESGRETGELLRVNRDGSGRVTTMSWATYLVTREPLAFGEWLAPPDRPT